MPTDTSEKGLESLIVHALAGGGQAKAAATPAATDSVVEALVPYGGAGYYFGRSQELENVPDETDGANVEAEAINADA